MYTLFYSNYDTQKRYAVADSYSGVLKFQWELEDAH
jgi:hypothetical protein